MALSIKGFLDNIQGKASETWRGITSVYPLRQAVWTPDDYEKMAQEGYEANVYAYSCIRQISMACAGIHLRVYRQDRKEERVEIPNHPLSKLLHRPNPMSSGTKFTEGVITSLLIAGNAYIERVGPSDTRPPLELYCLRADRMKVKSGDGADYVAGYEYAVGTYRLQFQPEQILHLYYYHPTDDWYGLPPLRAAMRAIDINNQAHSFDLAMLSNGAMPCGALKTTDMLTKDQKDDLKSSLKRGHSMERAFSPMVLDGGMEWIEMGLSPRDVAWLEGLQLSAREIAVAFGVPPELLGDSSQKTYSNFKEARQAFYTETVLPLMDWYIDELNNWLVPLYGDGIEVAYDRDDVEALMEDINENWGTYTNAVMNGIITVNEARELMGYDPVDGCDVLVMSSALAPYATTNEVTSPLPEEAPPAPPVPPVAQPPVEEPPANDVGANDNAV